MQIVSLVILALLSALIPREYLWIVFLLYFVVVMVITSRSVVRAAKKLDKPKSPLLFEEKNPSLAASSDVELLGEIKKQMSSMMLTLILPLMVFLLFMPFYWQYMYPTLIWMLKDRLSNDFLVSFIVYLIFYSTLILLSFGIRRILSKLMKVEKQILVPRSFAVYRDGVLADGRFFEFTNDMCYEVNVKRKFAAIHGKNLPFVLRLYTLETSKLKSALREGKIIECRW